MHLVWDWNDALGSANVPHAGLGYSHSPPGDSTGRGPGKFTRAPKPLNDAVNNTPLDHGFVKLYGGTIVQREHDWLIVSAIGGGSWGLAGMTAPNASGPYSHPVLLLWPQSGVFHPAPTEPYPAFSQGGFVYAPFTSVAPNRGYQIMYRAPLEQAMEPSAWEVVQTGSLYHWEGGTEGPIWGQTFSAHVDEAGDVMEVMFPSLSDAGVGAINLARRQWSLPFSHGFWVSAPAADSRATMLKTLGCFEMNLSVTLPVGGAWALHWNDRHPIASTGGPGFPGFPGTVPVSGISLSFDGRGGVSLALPAGPGTGRTAGPNMTCDQVPGALLRIMLVQNEGAADITLKGCTDNPVVHATIDVPAAAVGGGIVVEKGRGGTLNVSEMIVRETKCAKPPPPQRWVALLPSEAMGACFNSGSHRWQPVQSDTFMFGGGFTHPGGQDNWGYGGKQVAEEPMVKYNFVGLAARLRLPMGPSYGLIEVSIDGAVPQNISLYAPTNMNSSVVWSWRSPPPPPPLDQDDTDDPQQLRHAHAVLVRWRAPPPSPTAKMVEHPPWIPWVVAENQSAVFGVPIGGVRNAPLLGSNVTSVAECQVLCEAIDNCTTYSIHIPGTACWAGKSDPLGWCSKCFGRTDGVWQLQPVPGVVSARRVAPQKPPAPPPAPGPTQDTVFPVDVLEFLPAFADAEPLTNISNVLPRRDNGGEIINSHDGNLVQDQNSGAFYLYGVAFPLAITAADYNNCVLAGPPGVPLVYKPTAYRSIDLRSWELVSADLGVQWTASDQMNVRFNRYTGKYVAMYRGDCGAAALLVAISDGPIGTRPLPPVCADVCHFLGNLLRRIAFSASTYAQFNRSDAKWTCSPTLLCLWALSRSCPTLQSLSTWARRWRGPQTSKGVLSQCTTLPAQQQQMAMTAILTSNA